MEELEAQNQKLTQSLDETVGHLQKCGANFKMVVQKNKGKRLITRSSMQRRIALTYGVFAELEAELQKSQGINQTLMQAVEEANQAAKRASDELERKCSAICL